MGKYIKYLLTVLTFFILFTVNFSCLFAAEKTNVSKDEDYSGIYKSLKTKVILIKQKDKYIGKIYIKSKSYPLVAYNENGFLKGNYGFANQIQFIAKFKNKIMIFKSDLMKDYLYYKRGENFKGEYKADKILINLQRGKEENSITGYLQYNNSTFKLTGKVSGSLFYGVFKSNDRDYEYYMILDNNKLSFYTGGFSSVAKKMNSQKDELKSFVHIEPAGMKFVYIAPGTFEMGSEIERPIHSVTLTDPFLISQFTVTQNAYNLIKDMDFSNSDMANNYPVVNVSWYDAAGFCKKLTKYIRDKYSLPLEYEYRLPTEAEWEFAGKGGVISSDYKYSGSNDLDSVAWYRTNSGKKVHDIALKQPNELGIYDMSGNVLEWCLDWYHEYSSAKKVNPFGPRYGKDKVVRGGGFINDEKLCRMSSRSWDIPSHRYYNVGFRVVLAKKRSGRS